MTQNPGLNFDARCLFPACSSVLASSVIQDPTLVCPPAQVTCSVSDVKVTLDDVRAKSINVITQHCGSSPSSINKKTNSSTFLGMTSRQLIALSVLVGIMLLLIGLATIFGVRALRATKNAKTTLDYAAKNVIRGASE